MSDHDPRFACTLYAGDGTSQRFGPDEPDPENVVTDVTFGTQVPGWGFAEGTVRLNRPSGMSSLDAALFQRGVVYDESGQVIYRGRVASVPRVGTNEIELDFEGPLAHLDDDSSARMIYRETDLSIWEEPSRARQMMLLNGFYLPGAGEVSTIFDETGFPALKVGLDRLSQAYPPTEIAEAWLKSQLPIGSIGVGSYEDRSAGGAALAAPWSISLVMCSDDVNGNATATANLAGTLPAAGPFTLAPTDGVTRKYACIRFLYGGASTAEYEFAAFFRGIAVYGNHGLTKRGTEPNAGFYASDVVADALNRWAPLIDIAPNGIEQSTFIIPQLSFTDFGSTTRSIIEAVSLYGANGLQPPDYGYYEDGFFWKTPGTYGRTWRVRRDQGAISVDEGPTTESRCNGFIVSYTDAAGTQRSVGFPGSGADVETAALQDTSPSNPVNAAGIPRRVGSRDVGITTAEGATLLGQLLMNDANTRRYSGSLDLKGEIQDDAGNLLPSYLVRAGDYVVMEDDETSTPRKIVSTQYSNGTVNATCDNKSTSIDSLLSRLDVAIKPAGF